MSVEEPVPGRDVPGPLAPESRFIPPDDRCPHPERWHSTDGDSTEDEVSRLVAALVVALQPDLVVETGAAFGQTTAAISAALAETTYGGHLYALENDPERAEYARRRAPLGNVSVVEESSLDWTPPRPIDLLFSDSFYETRIPEFQHLRPWMRPGSTVVFHDTAPGRGGHRIPSGRSLREEIEALPDLLRVVHLPTPRGVSICEVLR